MRKAPWERKKNTRKKRKRKNTRKKRKRKKYTEKAQAEKTHGKSASEKKHAKKSGRNTSEKTAMFTRTHDRLRLPYLSNKNRQQTHGTTIHTHRTDNT